ncbi:MAG: hypothetical protein ACERKO_03460 [Acetanaerobacterium sp.]
MNMQTRYWRFLVQIKAWIFYLDIYADKSYKWEKRLNIWLAISSSSSIAAWAIWNEYGLIWAILIAVAQVITAIKPQLPFNKRLELIKPFLTDLQLLFNKVDYNWHKVSQGELNEGEINDLLFDFRNSYTEMETKNLKSSELITNKEIIRIADKRTDEFFRANY